MKKLHILFGLLLLMLCQMSNAQTNGLAIDLTSGLSIPKSQIDPDAAALAKGPQVNAGLSYLSKYFGLKMEGGYFKNALSQQTLQGLLDIPAAANLNFQQNSWQSIYGAIGPVLQLSKKRFGLQVSPKAGLMNIKSPLIARKSKATGQTSALNSSSGKDWQSFYALDAKLQYQLSDRVGLHLKADYLPNAIHGDDNPAQIDQVLQGLKGQKGVESLRSNLANIAQTSSSIFNLGAGITYQFGAKEATEEPEEKLQITCEPSVLINPTNAATFLLQSDQRPDFGWENSAKKGIKYYLFSLYEDGKLIYEEKSEGNTLKHSEQLEKVYQKAGEEEKRYSWTVTTFFADCEPATAVHNYFLMANRSGSFHDIFDLECDEPAYRPNGDLCFLGKISFFNNISTSDPLIINNFNDVIIQDALGNPLPGVSLSNITDCLSGFPVPTPIVIPPGGTQTYCFKIVVPAGHTAIRSEAHGTINGLPQMSTDQDDLPNCGCTICDKWRFMSGFSKMRYANNGNAIIFQDLQILNAAPIREVKAEIVYVKHVANDPECYTCTKHDDDMGLFSFKNGKPRVIITTGNWANSHSAYKGNTDINNDDFLNQAIWKATNPSVGVDFSSTGHRFRIPIRLPKPSSLKCCDHRYEVCIRYTVTDVNCATCDFLVCYQMTPRNSGGNGPGGGVGTGGGIGTGIGKDLGGIGIDPNIPLPEIDPKGGN